MTTTINPFSGQVYEISLDLSEPLVIENFDPTKDAIELPSDPNSEVIQHFSFSDRYRITELDGNSVISTLSGKILTVIEGVTGLQPFTSYTPDGSVYVVSLENEFFSTYIEPNFFEPWYLEFDASDYGNSVQKAIDAGIVTSAYEHYLKFGQFEAREDSLFAPTTDGNNTLYGSGYENGLVGVPISEGVYTRDVKPVTTGVGEIDTLVGAAGEDTFFLGNAAILNDAPQPFYVGQGDNDYVLIKNFDQGTTFGQLLSESPYYTDTPPEAREALTDRILLAGKPYDYTFEKVDSDLKISFQGDLIAVIEDALPIDVPFSIPGGTYIYTTGNVATFDLYSGWGTEKTLYEPFYFEENPEVEEAIANGEYASAFEHYVKVGQFNTEEEVIFSGSSGDDFLTGFGNSSLLFGVELTFVDGKKEGYRTASNGSGEADFAIGGLGIDTFFIGNDNILDPEKGGEVWYLGNDDDDYLTINSFDPYKDFIFGAGEFEDYSFEVIDETDDIFGRLVPYKSLEVSYQGDRVALLKYIDGSLTLPDLTSLIAFPLGDERPNALALVAPQNQFLEADMPFGSEFFNESLYLAVNPTVAQLVADGKYASGLEYYIKVGQFEGEDQTEGFFRGTEGSDAVTGFGADKDLVGVDLTASSDGVTITITPTTFGEGEIDVLLGDENEDGFYLGLPTSIQTETGQATTKPLYVGEGTLDYGLIRNFSEDDYVYLAGDPTDYIYKSEGGDFKVYDKTGDLIGVIQNIPELQISSYTPSFEGFTLGITEAGFNQSGWLSLYPEVQEQIDQGFFESALAQYINVGQYQEGGWIISGTTGNDTLISWTQNAEVRLAGVTLEGGFEPSGFEDGQYYFGVNPTSFGVGEIDILVHSTDTGTITESLLGWFRNADGTIQRFYVGQGDEDYALVKNFNKNDEDEIFLAGKLEDYTYEDVDGNLHIAYQGDLVGIIENLKYSELELADEGEGSGAFALIGIPEGTSPETPFTGEIYEIDPNATEALVIDNFNITKDVLQIAGTLEEYTIETTDENLQILAKNGELLATVAGVTELKPYTGNNPEGGTYLLSLENEFFNTYIEPLFYEPIYPVQNPDVVELVESGQYTSYYDHFLKAGQFEEREDTFFVGTEANDTLYSIGYESVLVGVPVSQAQYQGGLDVVPTNTGTGQIDTLYSGASAETIFVLGNSTVLNETAQSFYIGEGDADYALIKNFHEGDRLFLGSDPLDFTLETVDSNLEISKNGDLVAIVENLATNLVIQGEELVASPLDTYIQGTVGNDTLYATNEQTNIIGVPLSDENLQLVALGTGVGEVDILHDNEEGSATFYLGFVTADSPDTPVPFYIGNGDADYALIKDFNPTVDHPVQIAGQFDDYSVEAVDGNTRISKDGDLIAIAENVILVPDFEEGGFTNLYSSEDEYFVENTQPFFNESIYLQENPDAADAIAADEFTSGYQHFMRVGLLEGRYAYYNGTSGNEGEIYIMGNSYVLGVPVTEFDAATETFTTGTTGMGEADTLTGTVGTNKFVLGSNGQSFYLGQGDADYSEINSFDALKDEILLVGSYDDYIFNAVGDNLNIAKDGDLVAIVNGITEISPDVLSFS